MTDAESTRRIETTKEWRDCPHCGDGHRVEVVTEPGYERVVYCPRTGVAG